MMLLFMGCAHHTKTTVEKMVDPHYPKSTMEHTVTIDRVMITDADFHKSTTGGPLDVQVSLLENGREINPSTTNEFDGTRGERVLEKPLIWHVNFSPNNNYQLVVKEQAIIADASKWMIPETPKLGYWPIESKIKLGSSSYLHVTEDVAKP
jgi:hypothetical protein